VRVVLQLAALLLHLRVIVVRSTVMLSSASFITLQTFSDGLAALQLLWLVILS